MALEILTDEVFVDSLVIANPFDTDAKSQGDDHIRGLKNTLKNTLSDVSFPVSGYLADGGIADAYSATLSLTITSYIEGMEVYIKASASNTGASTAELNNLGAKTITHMNGNNLLADDVVTDMIMHLRDDGTNFQLLNPFWKSYIDDQAFSSALPLQSGNAGKTIVTDGSSSSWVFNDSEYYFFGSF